MVKHRVLFLAAMAVLVTGFAVGSEPIPNWPAPATWSPPSSSGVRTLSDIGYPSIFVPVTPCRVADTRGNGFIGAYGPPSLVANAIRSFTITGVCGIPTFAQAVSFNFLAANVGAGGDLRVFPAGGSAPLVSTINYTGTTPNIANAAVVPLGGGGISVQADAVSIDLVIDVNGYYTGGNTTAGTLNDNEDFALINDSAPSWCATVYVQNHGSHGTSDCIAAVMGELFGTAANGSGANFIQHATTTGGRTSGVRAENDSTAGSSVGIHAISGAPTTGAPNDGLFHAGGLIETANDGNGLLVSAGDGGFCINWAVRAGVFNTSGALTSGAYLGSCGGPGVSYVGGLGGSGTKNFLEPHPTDPSKMIRYTSLEGNEAGTYFRGTARTVGGYATIEVPETFRIVTDDEGLSTQLTPVGLAANMYIVSEDLNHIVVHSSKDVTFHYLVQGVRRAYKNLSDVTDNYFFRPESPTARMPQYSAVERERLIQNGTYNQDGTVNMATAEKVGWAATWRAVAEQAESQNNPTPDVSNANKPN